MAYSTTIQAAQYSGLRLRAIDEKIGTGNNDSTDFDLANDNVLSDSYSISYAESGSNTFTALTETTHYTLDKESGRIVLTGAGVTLVATDVLYATYSYTESFSDEEISNFITSADEEVDLLTGKKWDTPVSKTEYLDGRHRKYYPTTDYPYAADWDAPDYLQLTKVPVTQIENVYFLQVQSVYQFYNYDDDAATYTDYTDNCNTTDSAQFTLFAAVPATNDIIYIGCSTTFLGLDTSLTTLGTGSPAIDWEYWNGTAWTDLTETDVDTGASTFEVTGRFTWPLPSNWAKVSVNGSDSHYYVRGKVTTGYTIAPICNSLSIYDAIYNIPHPRAIKYDSTGKISFLETIIPNGTENIRITYSYGTVTTPALISELSAILTSIKSYVNLSGGSYDDATNYQLGSKAVTIGEVYVNIREVIDQFRKRKTEILKLMGRRSRVF